MWRDFIGVFLLLAGLSHASFAQQLEKHFSVENGDDFSDIVFRFRSNGGRCYVTPKIQDQAVRVYGNRKIDDFVYDFNREVVEETCFVNLKVADKNKESIGQTISLRMFSEEESEEEEIWKIYLNPENTAKLDLTYGLGDAFIDLSGLGVNNLKVNTGSADVNLGYQRSNPNRVIMDSMLIQVDLGTLNIRNIPMARARNIQADVGFGTLNMDFREKAMLASVVDASVGAGDLVIMVSDNETPMKINITDSFLCKVSIADSFTEIKKNTWVNKHYSPYADNLVTFNVDVSMGSIIFREQ